MRKSRLRAEQIASSLDVAGESTEVTCKRLGISEATFYRMKKRYSGLDKTRLEQIIDLEEESARLRFQVNRLRQDQRILKDLLTHVIDQQNTKNL